MGAQLKHQRLRLLIVEAGFKSVFSFLRPKTRHVVYLLPASKQRWWSPSKCSLVSTDTTQAVVLKKRERNKTTASNRRREQLAQLVVSLLLETLKPVFNPLV